MRYRIKKETYIDVTGYVHTLYYPQHKHWWCPWWHNFGETDEYTDYEYFRKLEDAEKYLEWFKSKHHKVEYIYYS